MSGTQDVVIGGGVEVMSMVPIGASIKDGYEAGHGLPFDSDGMKDRYPGIFFSQFTGAELMAEKWNLSREDLDKFALSSHQKLQRQLRVSILIERFFLFKQRMLKGRVIWC